MQIKQILFFFSHTLLLPYHAKGDIMKANLTLAVCGSVSGALNGLFGSGGGLPLVIFLKKYGLDAPHAHATSVGITFFLSVVSAGVYLFANSTDIALAARLIPGGFVGALLGTALLKRLNPELLKKVFAVILLISGVRLLF